VPRQRLGISVRVSRGAVALLQPLPANPVPACHRAGRLRPLCLQPAAPVAGAVLPPRWAEPRGEAAVRCRAWALPALPVWLAGAAAVDCHCLPCLRIHRGCPLARRQPAAAASQHQHHQQPARQAGAARESRPPCSPRCCHLTVKHCCLGTLCSSDNSTPCTGQRGRRQGEGL
jgi:hypothetical protein